MRLTIRYGIDGWTIRALAHELEVAQAVVHHHWGRRQLVRSVGQRVGAQIPLPEGGLPWRQWFGTCFTDVSRGGVASFGHGPASRGARPGPVAGAQRVIDAARLRR
ncbi:hypothetical protein AB0M48_11920 [Lentzea sp. NPDC051208]|uniref:hypothetical protein n=1 Tax=Lentzea sp. NPDC051208 TaxID=3154642 RepID=UPI00341493EC